MKKDILQRRIDSMIRTATSGKRANTDSPSTIEDIKDLQYKIERIVKNITNYLSLIADDTTVEALISKMSENGEKMALVSSEGGIFNTLAGLYSGEMTNMDIILKAFSGDFVQVDRKGKGTLSCKKGSCKWKTISLLSKESSVMRRMERPI